ncbi:hypothetical protein WA026_015822 [Henosepilachna vigintioctopunctata]|uniref:Phorbol-ester/DAG-type domain-containing protein n=1 Tax=Henosepilachna vigintioctopunctata TaxID=420089 RepID=A0AAW1UZJ5_9CUCU
MATSDDESEIDSRKIKKSNEFKCQYCNKRVVESSTCAKCQENFHPSCLIKSAEQKSTTCKHEAILPVMRGEHINLPIRVYQRPPYQLPTTQVPHAIVLTISPTHVLANSRQRQNLKLKV